MRPATHLPPFPWFIPARLPALEPAESAATVPAVSSSFHQPINPSVLLPRTEINVLVAALEPRASVAVMVIGYCPSWLAVGVHENAPVGGFEEAPAGSGEAE